MSLALMQGAVLQARFHCLKRGQHGKPCACRAIAIGRIQKWWDFVQDPARAWPKPHRGAVFMWAISSQPRGGPMLSGHTSHQSGLDADIWLLPARDLNLSIAARESLSPPYPMQAQRGAAVNENWTAEHATRCGWRRDPRVSRIFVFPAAKVWMCENETGDRSYLRKIRPWFGHHYHIHVRLNCPVGARDCEAQRHPPLGMVAPMQRLGSIISRTRRRLILMPPRLNRAALYGLAICPRNAKPSVSCKPQRPGISPRRPDSGQLSIQAKASSAVSTKGRGQDLRARLCQFRPASPN